MQSKRVLRAKREAHANQVSNKIDAQLRKERAAQKDLVRVLLLGQSESDKSTFLQNFLIMYSFPQWKAERRSRRAAIQLKLVHSVLTILDIIEAEMNGTPSMPISVIPEEQFSAAEYNEEDNPTDEEEDNLTDEEDNQTSRVTTNSVSTTNTSRRSSLTKHSSSRPRTATSNQHFILRPSSGLLHYVDAVLKKRLGTGPSDEDFDSSWSLGAAREGKRSEFGMKRFLETLGNGAQVLASDGSDHGQGAGNLEAFPSDEATDIIANCKDDMKALWADEDVRNVLAKRNAIFDDGEEFFLDNIDRIAIRTYEPSNDDFVRARPPTVGVQEYNIEFECSIRPTPPASDFQREQWIMYDVGGSRTMRHTWLRFFDNVDAIIFFASLSCFDEHLEEDYTINRLEDTLVHWRSVCSSGLLANTGLILLLSKCDILERKLNSGVMVKTYIPSYGERPNDAESVSEYFKGQFGDIFKAQSQLSRPYYCTVTSATDANATVNVLRFVRAAVQDCILQTYLRYLELI